MKIVTPSEYDIIVNEEELKCIDMSIDFLDKLISELEKNDCETLSGLYMDIDIDRLRNIRNELGMLNDIDVYNKVY